MNKYGFQTPLIAEAVDKMKHHRRVMLQLPTGGGKTTIARTITERYGRVHLVQADAWVTENVKSDLPNGYTTRVEFARRHGVAYSAVDSWIKRGLPVDRYSRVHLVRGDAWVAANVNLGPPKGYVTRAEFARRHGVMFAAVGYWVKRGLPVNEHGHVHSDPADAWVAEFRKKSKRSSANAKLRQLYADGREMRGLGA